MPPISGKVWKFGHNIDTDIIIAARHLVLPMEEMKMYAMASVQPEFAATVKPCNVMVAGRNFGCGSSREQAPAVLKALGINTIVAVSFARIFFRNAVNLGLTVMECPILYDHVERNDIIELNPVVGKIYLPVKAMTFSATRLPDFLLEIVNAGGLIAHLTSKVKKKDHRHADTFGSKINNSLK
ncbi:MAG: 3-isopropylmalate dehydratase [Desulfobacteraceae bacterium]